ncbi:PucR family transcriptional regulator [Nocardia salmonicida]|uniref:PucR family transcriptional regulator n=1 Tax=Nocardia salmonicida TaxID=53431 RepID=UPI0036BD9FE1
MDMSSVAQSLRTHLGAEVVAVLHDTVASRLDDIAVELTRLYQAKIPIYEKFDPALIEHNTRSVLMLVADQLSEGSSELATDGLIEYARMLSEQGTPLGPVAHSIQLGARLIMGIVRDRALELGVSDADVAAVADIAWEWATEAASVVQALQQDLAIAGATRRADFLRLLITGAIAPALFAADAAALGIDPDHHYHLACTRGEETRTGSDVLTALRVHGSTADLPTIDALIDGQFVALLPRRPDRRHWPRAIGVGPAVELARARVSYEHAQRACQIAERHNINGIVDLGSLGPSPLLDQATEAATALDERHFAPLRQHGASGQEIAGTVSTYLELDRRVEDTARALHIHRNTVRYRLTRFTTLTGLDLDRTDDLVLAWWLLNRQQPPRTETSPEPTRDNDE